MQAKTKQLKKKMLASLEKNLSIVTKSAKDVGIDRATHYNWLKKDKVYKQEVELITDGALDFVEDKLMTNIRKGSDTAIIFYLKTKGKKRGYVEKNIIDTHIKFGKDLEDALEEETYE